MLELNKMFPEIEKKHKGALTVASATEDVSVIGSTGSVLLDSALECGGNPSGRILEYYGMPSGGKTSLALTSIAEVQKAGGIAAYFDLENTFNKNWVKKLGVDIDKLILFQTKPGQSGDVAFDVMEMMILSGKVSLIVLDSVSALATAAELNGEFGDAQMAQLARLMSSGLKKINNSLSGSKCSVIFINQIRTDIRNYGAFETTSGGNALEFYSSIRLNVKRKDVIGPKEDPIGFTTEIKIVKNKVGKPFKRIVTNFYVGGKDGFYGINKDEELFDTAVSFNIIKKSEKAGWYKYNEELVDQGKDNAIKTLKEQPEKFNEIKEKVIKQLFEQIDMPIEGSFDAVIKQEIKTVPREPRKVTETDQNTINEMSKTLDKI